MTAARNTLDFQADWTRSSLGRRPSIRRFSSLVAGLLLLASLGLAGCGGGVETRLEEIRKLQSAGEYDPSIAPLREILAMDAENAEANYRLGLALALTGRPSLAVWPLQKASESEEFAVTGGLLLASTLLDTNQYEECIRAATRVLEVAPQNISAMNTRAQAHIFAGSPEKGLLDADRVLELRPDNERAVGLRAGALIDLDRPAEAEEAWLDLVARAEKGSDKDFAARACGALAIFYRSQENAEQTEATYGNCLAKYPSHRGLQQWAAEYYMERGQPEDAVAIWKRATEETPEDLNLRRKLVESYVAANQIDEAKAAVEETVELFDTPEAWRMLANFHRRNGDPKAARKSLEEAISRVSRPHPAVMFALADLMIEGGDLEAAEEVAAGLEDESYRMLLAGAIALARQNPELALEKLDAGLRVWPNNAGARYMAGRAAQALGKRDRAILEYREAVRVDDTETDAALRLAEIHYSLGNYTTARQFAERQIRKRPYDGPRAHVIAARAAQALGDAEGAARILSNLRQIDPAPESIVEFANILAAREGQKAVVELVESSGRDLSDLSNEPVLRVYAQALFATGDQRKALSAVRSALTANPDAAPLHDLNARLLLISGRVEAGRDEVAKALELDPKLASAHEILGSLAAQSGEFDAAQKHYDDASAAAPNDPQYSFQAAQVALHRGDQAGAIERLEKTLTTHPAHAEASRTLAWLLATDKKDLDRALTLAKVAVREAPGPDANDTLGYVYFQRGQLPEAIAAYKDSLEQREDSPSVLYRLGVAFASAGDADQAREMLKKALGSRDFPESQAARAELTRLQGS